MLGNYVSACANSGYKALFKNRLGNEAKVLLDQSYVWYVHHVLCQCRYEELNSSFVEYPSSTQCGNSTVSCSVTPNADKGNVSLLEAISQSGECARQQSTKMSLSTLVDSDFEEACVITTGLLKKLSDHRLLTPASKESERSLEEIETTLLSLARRCRKDVNFTSHAATCFATNTELLQALVAMLDGFFQGKTFSR